MFTFIKYFFNNLFFYPHYKAYWDESPKMLENFINKGEWVPKNRFDFAWTLAKLHYAHRDRYGRKCKKYNGDCEKCNAKHC